MKGNKNKGQFHVLSFVLTNQVSTSYLGRAFVVNNFDNLWIYWLGPGLGCVCAALCHEYIFNEQKDVYVTMSKIASPVPSETEEDFELR